VQEIVHRTPIRPQIARVDGPLRIKCTLYLLPSFWTLLILFLLISLGLRQTSKPALTNSLYVFDVECIKLGDTEITLEVTANLVLRMVFSCERLFAKTIKPVHMITYECCKGVLPRCTYRYPFDHQSHATLDPVSSWMSDRPNGKL
jgi:hypothetical protein